MEQVLLKTFNETQQTLKLHHAITIVGEIKKLVVINLGHIAAKPSFN